jgi:glycosyltransferase involved in cell wall biosynthesis
MRPISGRKKILVLASTFPRWKDDVEPRFVEYLCEKLAATHSVTVLAPHYPGAKIHEKLGADENDFEVYRFRYFVPSLQLLAYDGGILANIRGNMLNVFLVPFFLVAQVFKVATLHRKYDFDVIHAHWIIPQGFVAAIFSTFWWKAPPIVITSHGGDLFALRGRLLTAIKRWILNTSKKITVVSRIMKSTCEELGIAADKIHVRSMGVDLTSLFTPGGGTIDRNDLIFVGRLVEKKGVGHLIRAMATLTKKHPELSLTIVGDGPDRKSLESLAIELQLGTHVLFVGHKMNTELPELLRAAKIAVMPSIVAKSGDQEGLGLVAIEAMGCGCAVVATDLAAIRDTVRHGDTGLIAIAGDEGDLAEKIDTLLNDETLTNKIAGNGRKFALQYFDWKVVGKEYVKLLADL